MARRKSKTGNQRESKIAAAREKMAKGDLTDAQALAEERAKAKTKRHAAERRKVVKALEDEIAELGERTAFLDRLFDAPDPKPIKVRAKRRGQGSKKGTPPAATYVMLASDWHWGERVRPENVGGRNEYSPEIAEERATQFWKSNLIMLNAARAAWTIDQGLLWLGGDLMTGAIHEEYLEENFLSPVEEALAIFDHLKGAIPHFLNESGLESLLIVTSNGNHGRTGLRIKISTYAKNSYEWLLYQMLARYFENDSRIKFQIGTGYNNLVDLYGFRIQFHHGDAVGYGGGIGGLAIPVNKRIGRAAQSVPIRWEGTNKGAVHLNVFGHFHQLQYPKGFIGNGSLIGWNDFAERIGCSYEDPQQCSFVVDNRFKVVSNWNPIIVDKRLKK